MIGKHEVFRLSLIAIDKNFIINQQVSFRYFSHAYLNGKKTNVLSCFSHVVICGHITPHSMTTFLRDFLHKDRDQAEELDVVIINK